MDPAKSLSLDYADYFTPNFEDEFSRVGDSIEYMLTRLEEFQSLMETTDVGVSEKLTSEVETSVKNSLENIFDEIDKVEQIVNVVKQDLNKLESILNDAENCGATSPSDFGFRNFFKPLFLRRTSDSSSTQNIKSPTFEIPDFFKTEDLLQSLNESSNDSK